MPGPQAKPEGGKTNITRHKPKHPNRERIGKGEHKPGSQNRNKNRGKHGV